MSINIYVLKFVIKIWLKKFKNELHNEFDDINFFNNVIILHFQIGGEKSNIEILWEERVFQIFLIKNI